MALRRKLKQFQEKNKRHSLVYWPDENSYSEVPESKIVEPKDPAIGQMVKVKEGSITFSGKVEAIGSKAELEKQLCDLDKEEEKEEPVPAATTTESDGQKKQCGTSRDKPRNDSSKKGSKKGQARKRGRQDSGAGKPAKKKKPEGRIIRTVTHERPTTPPAADPVEESPAEEPPAADPVEHSSMNSLDTSISSVPPLPSPIKLLDNESLPRNESDESIDPLSLEMEVQDLVDRVVTLETGQEAILQAQKSILQKQNEIMSRLSAIENQLKAPTLPQSYLPFIPPPPSHAPPVLNDYSYDDYSFNENSFNDTSLRPPARSRGFSPPAYVPPRHAVYSQDEHQHGESMSSEAANPNPRIPFRPLQQNNYTPGDVHGQVIQRKKKSAVGTLPSSTINKDKLIPVSNVFQKYPKLLCESKVGTLAVKLAKDAFFGEEVMVQCTVAGERDLPGLPAEELRQLKHALYMQFRQYWESPQEFEQLWKISTEAIGQACKRLRSKK